MDDCCVKARPRPLLLLLPLLLAVAAGPEVVAASSRSSERVYSSLHELTEVLREGFSTLTDELREERASREDLTRFLKAQVQGIHRAVQGLCRGVRLLSGGGDDGCSDGGDTGMDGRDGEGRESGTGTEVKVGSNHRPQVNMHENIHSQDPSSPPVALAPPPDPVACPPPYQGVGVYCLTLLQERVSWKDARVRCHSFAQERGGAGEGDLAVVDDMDTFKNFVANTDFSGAPSGMAMVGGSADGWGGAWVWLDGSLIKQLPWLYSQTGHEGSVLAVDRDGIFHTVIRRSSLWPLCQLK